ncbi:uncharacterized protein N7484_000274 [Penicillium longicatenatum]|uniref:uncharacterized protein n=1 Tax=Penicillium longicatenatum TaxID=1561947 RepID=UPI00254798ED|nr:uncharacterized protein N7484_000274 [Penicillium longicatenatum]KAJ5660902.1 hypothetical protein N7484_000274 [Penicillium longicatenatum]
MTDNVVTKPHDVLKCTIPLAFTLAWHKAYGVSDLLSTIDQVQHAAMAIEDMWNIHCIDSIPGELSKRITNPNFLSSDLGKFVQIAVLVGHEIVPEQFFAKLATKWNGESLLEIKEICEVQDRNGNLLVRLRALYIGTELHVTKQVDEIVQMIYRC